MADEPFAWVVIVELDWDSKGSWLMEGPLRSYKEAVKFTDSYLRMGGLKPFRIEEVW